jgi:hypothetical protein
VPVNKGVIHLQVVKNFTSEPFNPFASSTQFQLAIILCSGKFHAPLDSGGFEFYGNSK